MHCFLDEQSNRLMGSSKIEQIFINEELTVKRFDEVDLLISHFSDLGINAIINNKHKGVIYHNEIYEQLSVGQSLKGTIKLIRADNKMNLSLLSYGI